MSSKDTQPEAAGFFARVKDFFDGFGNRQARLTCAADPTA